MMHLFLSVYGRSAMYIDKYYSLNMGGVETVSKALQFTLFGGKQNVTHTLHICQNYFWTNI